MAQARRIKPKTSKKKPVKRSRMADLPWGLMFVILVSGVVLGVLFSGAQREDSQFGQGLKALMDESPKAQQPSNQVSQATKDSIESGIGQTEFDYYEVLPDIEQVMPDDLPDGAVEARRSDGYEYFIQIASFRNREDAEALRARLALQGVEALTQAREVDGKGLFFRVRLGPFANTRLAKTAKARLNGLGQDPFIYRSAKSAD